MVCLLFSSIGAGFFNNLIAVIWEPDSAFCSTNDFTSFEISKIVWLTEVEISGGADGSFDWN